MKDEDVDQRHAAAYHEAAHAVMAFYLGGWVNDEGVEIDERQYCGLDRDQGLLGWPPGLAEDPTKPPAVVDG